MSMIEYRDGHFGEIKELWDCVEEMFEDPGIVKSLHVGSIKELDEIRRQEKHEELEDRIRALEEQVKEIKLKESDFLIIPTKEEKNEYGSFNGKI